MPQDVTTALANADEPRKLDALVEQVAEPDLSTIPVSPPSGIPAAPLPAFGNRTLVAGVQAVSVGWDPVRLLVSDDYRVELHLSAASDTDTDYVLYADDPSKLSAEMNAARLYSGQEKILKRYHGPIYISAPSTATGPITVDFTAVTR